MASIRTRKTRDGKVRYQVQVRREGFKPVVETFATLDLARRWARDQEAKIDRGGFEDVSTLRRTTVGDLLDRFLKEKVPQRRGERWEKVRISMLKRDAVAKRRLDQDVAGALRDWVERRGRVVSAATIVRDLNLLSAIFGVAMREWGVPLSVNPTSLVKRPVVDKTPKARVWTEDAVERLRAAAVGAPEDVAAAYVVPALELSIETAMRRGELCAFRAEHVDLEARTIWLPPEVTKTGVGRHVLLSTRAVDLVKELLNRNPKGRVIPVEPDTLGLRFRQLRRAAGVEGLRLHDGRHTAATRAAEVFSNVLELSAFTGHRSLQTLKRYYHPDASSLAAKLK
jgi:integrase